MTFYFYDLETSGRNPREARIMQFAGQRTDLELKPLGKPDNMLIKLTPDTLPEPDAILTHGISPQRTLAEGVTEAEFLRIFNEEIVQPNTTFVGYSNIRFDDEFMRFTLWRNFYDAYEWQWKDGSSRWDLLDVARMTRALRPEGIKWPQADADNRLEVLSELNRLEHIDAHDALSDVKALIALARLIRAKQPKLFDYLLHLRDKNKLGPFISSGKPFVYTSGRYPKENLHTSLAVKISDNPKKQSAFVYDLRVDPKPFLKKSPQELAELWRYKPWRTEADKPPYFPIKELPFNKCAAVAPQSVLDELTIKRLQLDMGDVKENIKKLQNETEFGKKVAQAWQILYPEAKKPPKLKELDVDGRLYDDFLSGADRTKMSAVRAASPQELTGFLGKFTDERLNLMLPLYKARNWPGSLTDKERSAWESFCRKKLTAGGEHSQAVKFFDRLHRLGSRTELNREDRFLLEELNLYAQSIAQPE